MQGIVDACVSAAESIDQRQARIEANKRQVIAELEQGHFNVNRFDAVAAMIERAAEAQRQLKRYRNLIAALHRKAVGERVEQRAAAALRRLWGVS